MEPLNPNDVKVRAFELPRSNAVAPDQLVVVDGDSTGARAVTTTVLAADGLAKAPAADTLPSINAELLAQDAGQVRRYRLANLVPRDFYLGAFATAPRVQPSGLPLAVGNIYLNSTTNQTFVWLGAGANLGWQLFGQPVPANQTSYHYYFDEPTQFVGGPDELGRMLSFSAFSGDTVDVYLNGAKLIAQADYQLREDATIRIGLEVPAGSICEVVVRKFAELNYKTTPVLIDTDAWVRDGVERQYRMHDKAVEYITPGSASNCLVVINGQVLEPERDFIVFGDRIRFTNPPAPGARLWIVVGVPFTPPAVVNVLTVNDTGTELAVATGVGLLTYGQTPLPAPSEIPTQLPDGLVPVTEAPTPGVEYHGKFVLLSRPAMNDALYVCMKRADGTYGWLPILYMSE